VRLNLKGEIESRSFPFFALSLEHARQELIAMQKHSGNMPFTDIFQYGALYEKQKKYPLFKKEDKKINIETGKKS